MNGDGDNGLGTTDVPRCVPSDTLQVAATKEDGLGLHTFLIKPRLFNKELWEMMIPARISSLGKYNFKALLLYVTS